VESDTIVLTGCVDSFIVIRHVGKVDWKSEIELFLPRLTPCTALRSLLQNGHRLEDYDTYILIQGRTV
jgi:hypothetical protein